MAREWEFEADYFTTCNCDWGCPCNFNARPTLGTCHGLGAWRIRKGRFGATRLDGAKFAMFYAFPGLIEHGNGVGAMYFDASLAPAQREALEKIGRGQHGGGVFAVFATLVTKWLPPRTVPIELDIDQGGKARLSIPDLMEAESELLSYPDGSTIRPTFELPHGIEYKRALATNAKRWWIRDEELLGTYRDRYGAVTVVRFDETGCVG